MLEEVSGARLTHSYVRIGGVAKDLTDDFDEKLTALLDRIEKEIMTEVEGARVQVQLANTQPDQVRLDMPLRYVFRKIHDAGGKANYFWKAAPADEGAAQ